MLDRFVQYAAAFEKAYASADYAALAPFFTEEAEYVIHRPARSTLRYEGREAVLGFFEWITAEFDRKFASRRVVPLSAPRAEGDEVEVHGLALYTMASGERCHFTMTETAHFSEGRIARLVDRITPGGELEMRLVVEAHPEVFLPAVLEGKAPVGDVEGPSA